MLIHFSNPLFFGGGGDEDNLCTCKNRLSALVYVLTHCTVCLLTAQYLLLKGA